MTDAENTQTHAFIHTFPLWNRRTPAKLFGEERESGVFFSLGHLKRQLLIFEKDAELTRLCCPPPYTHFYTTRLTSQRRARETKSGAAVRHERPY